MPSQIKSAFIEKAPRSLFIGLLILSFLPFASATDHRLVSFKTNLKTLKLLEHALKDLPLDGGQGLGMSYINVDARYLRLARKRVRQALNGTGMKYTLY